jgi:hypothetical protein
MRSLRKPEPDRYKLKKIPAAGRGFVNDEVIEQGRPGIVKMCVTGTRQYE